MKIVILIIQLELALYFTIIKCMNKSNTLQFYHNRFVQQLKET